MNYSEYFPFLLESKVIRRSTLNNQKLDKIVSSFNSNVKLTDKNKFDSLLDSTKISTGARIPLVRIVPNNVLIYVGTDERVNSILSADESLTKDLTVNLSLTELDYGRLAQRIEYVNNNHSAAIRHGSDYELCDIVTTEYIEDAKLGQHSLLEGLNKSLDNVKTFNEDDIDDLFKGVNNLADPVEYNKKNSTDPAYVDVIRNYLSSDSKTEKIPLLVGMSGVAKSAIVKSLADELGLRLVDLRVSFMSRLDIDGLCEIVGKEVGEPVSINAPMVEFLTCTDEYIDFSRNVLTKLTDKLNSLDQSDPKYQEYKSGLEDAINKFKESSKIPVLFFDEITRSDKSIRGALTTIINQRIYGNYHLNYARMIAATNAVVGYDDDEDMQDLFIGTSLEDVAVLDRFNKVTITPEEAFPSWWKWANKNLDSDVLAYIDEDPSKAYDLSPAEEFSHDYDREDDLIPPYPTYRAWENISNYLKSLTPTDNNTKYISKEIITGLLGTPGEQFISWLLDDASYITSVRKFTYADKYDNAGDRDELTDFIGDSLDSGLPTMVMGASGLGKTTRVREYCEKHGYDFELISLSTKDRMDIMGPPAKVDITRYIAKETSTVLDELGLMPDIQSIKDKSGLPNSVTLRSPNKTLQDKIKRGTQSGKKMVLFFDEFNRCQDPTVQSSIFQAISDHQFGGVSYDPANVKIALAGNLGETTGEAGGVDAALTARAVQFKKMGYDEKDAKAVLSYMKSHNYAESLLSYIGNDYEKVLDLIKSVDEGSLTKNVSSTRSLKALSDMLLNSTESQRLHGAMLCPDKQEIQEFNIDPNSNFDKMLSKMSSRLKTWSAIGTYKYPGGTDLDQAIDIFYKGRDAYEVEQDSNRKSKLRTNLLTMMTNFLLIDEQISEYRQKVFSYYVDENFAEDFTDYYNMTTGLSNISIEDLIDETLIPKYVSQEFTKLDAALPDWKTIVDDVSNYYDHKMSDSGYVTLLSSCFSNDTSTENSRSVMKDTLSNKVIESVILDLENSTDADTINSYRDNILNPLKLSDDYDNYNYNQVQKQTTTSYSRLGNPEY